MGNTSGEFCAGGAITVHLVSDLLWVGFLNTATLGKKRVPGVWERKERKDREKSRSWPILRGGQKQAKVRIYF